MVKTLQYEAVKVAMKQDKTGIVLTLNIHPDEVPESLMRDYVGARYQVVMVRLNGEEKPMNRDHEYSRDLFAPQAFCAAIKNLLSISLRKKKSSR
jgi:uncharacterized protein YcgL (UPF0745 family)